MVDVTPLTLGIETYGGIMTPLINRNSTIPISITKEFTTSFDYQKEVEIKIFQGERKLAKHNKKLGEFKLVGIHPAKKGIPKIEVTFDIDENGIVHVSAKDKGTGKSTGIKIQNNGGLSDEEIEKIIKDSKKFDIEDKKNEEIIKMKQSIFYNLENSNDLIEDLKKKKINFNQLENVIKEVNEYLNNHNYTLDELKKLNDKLNDEMNKCSSLLYK